MADTPEVLRRLEEIEAWGSGSKRICERRHKCNSNDIECELRWLLRLTRALLKSQVELMETMPANCRFGPECPYCRDMVARAERVRRGEV